jgi:gliding motility associated protien GldN
MKRQAIKFSLILVLVSAIVADANAQRRGNRRTNNPPENNQQQQNNNANPPSQFDPYGNIPIRVDSSAGGGLDTNVRKSMRQESAFARDTNQNNKIVPLDYEFLRWDDALYAEKVWRDLDLREKMNQSFRYTATEDNGDQQFISILLNAVRTGKVLAFDDERFTQPLTIEQVQEKMGGAGADTTNITAIDDPSRIVERVVTPRTFNAKSVMKLRLKEEWIFDREASRMFCRIIGICPIKTVYFEGTTRERGVEPMFWIYYPDLRPTLANFNVYNSKNMGASKMTWEELFESRLFSSYIIKSTLDNPGNKTIARMIKDPILQLLEGDNIKERMFNYEQDLWSY